MARLSEDTLEEQVSHAKQTPDLRSFDSESLPRYADIVINPKSFKYFQKHGLFAYNFLASVDYHMVPPSIP